MTFKYFRSILWGFALSSLVFFGAAAIQMNAPTPTSQWIYDLYLIKAQIAEKLDSPKLVVAAGSNAMIGISCQQIQTITGVPCLNGAINVGLGLDYILYQARNFSRPGDTVLLPLEYELYETSVKPSSVAIDYIFSRDLQYWQAANFMDKMRFVCGLGFKRILVGFKSKLQYSAETSNTVRRLKSVDEAGDWIKNRPQDLTLDHQRRSLLLTPYKSDNLSINSYSQAKITDFVDWCRDRDITVVATWPNTIKYPEYAQAEYQTFFDSIKAFYQQINIPIIGRPEEYMYDKSMFFDSNYHLNDRGVAVRTEQLINALACQADSSSFCLAQLQADKT